MRSCGDYKVSIGCEGLLRRVTSASSGIQRITEQRMQGINYICYLDDPNYREEFRKILKESLKEVLKRFQNLLGRLYKFRMRPCQLHRISQNLESF